VCQYFGCISALELVVQMALLIERILLPQDDLSLMSQWERAWSVALAIGAYMLF
jgi:hypothetical protein